MRESLHPDARPVLTFEKDACVEVEGNSPDGIAIQEFAYPQRVATPPLLSQYRFRKSHIPILPYLTGMEKIEERGINAHKRKMPPRKRSTASHGTISGSVGARRAPCAPALGALTPRGAVGTRRTHFLGAHALRGLPRLCGNRHHGRHRGYDEHGKD